MFQRAVILMVLSLGAATPAFAGPILVTLSQRNIYAYVQVRSNGAFVADSEPAPYATTQPGIIDELLVAAVTVPAGTGTATGSQVSNIDPDGVFSGALTATTTSTTATTYSDASSHYWLNFTLDSPYSYTLGASVAGGFAYFQFCQQGAPCIFEADESGSVTGAFGTLAPGSYFLRTAAIAEGQNQTIASTVNFDLRLVALDGPPATPAPEPASMLLLGTGLLGAGVRRWRQKRA